jgi:hypothetical protein
MIGEMSGTPGGGPSGSGPAAPSNPQSRTADAFRNN